MAGANGLLAVAVRQGDGGGRALGHVYVEHEGVAVKVPRDLDAVRRAPAPRQVAHGVRSNDGFSVVAPDAQDVGDEQVVEVAHHEVVHGGSVLGVPLLGQRGMAEAYLIAVAGDVVVVKHRV